MKILIVNTDYSDFLTDFYRMHPGLDSESYERQMQVRYDTLFGVADFYSRNLRTLGHDARDVYINNLSLQRTWLSEQGLSEELGGRGGLQRIAVEGVKAVVDRIPSQRVQALLRAVAHRLCPDDNEGRRIFAAQVKSFRPDVLLNQAMDGIGSDILYEVKPWVRLLVGQHAATSLPDNADYRCYDLIVSSFQPTVEFFQRKGIPACLHRLGFDQIAFPDEVVLGDTYPVTFVGSLSAVHQSRIDWLEQLCAAVPELRIWGPGAHLLSNDSAARERHMGVVWGRDMYKILRRSKITLNHHGDVAPYANNCRLYEATGMGAMLITDWKANLSDLFAIDAEVAAYKTTEECAALIRYYLDNDEARAAVAKAGQARTLLDHTYLSRMQEFVEIVKKRLAA